MPEKIKVYYNWGRWVADCPRPGCGSAERYDIDPLSGVLGMLTHTDFYCQPAYGGCGFRGPVEWPDETDQRAIEILLAPRLPKNRNWVPGESIEDLLIEGMANGVDIANDIRQRYGLDSGSTEHPPTG